MASSAAAAPPLEPSTTKRNSSYSRKQKSLGLLCSNFLSLYNRDDGATSLIGLDDAASRLGVVRRRIYDIVNVLESVGLLARKSKNTYTWKGFGAIPSALKELKDEGLDLTPIPACNNNNNPQDETKREKSLALLAQNFVKLFVCSGFTAESKSISLEDAAKLLLGVGDSQNVSVMRTKVRRIYDIANVLSSVSLIEKIHTADTGKPAYRWLGLNGKTDDLDSNSAPNSDQSKRRSFGTDLTNVSCKRSRVAEKPMQDRGEVDESNSDGAAKESYKSYQFGPFAPVAVPRARRINMNKVRWESLGASYRPQYQNQALKELFSHYREAWKSWNSKLLDASR